MGWRTAEVPDLTTPSAPPLLLPVSRGILFVLQSRFVVGLDSHVDWECIKDRALLGLLYLAIVLLRPSYVIRYDVEGGK